MEAQIHPPIALIKTWISLINSNESPEVREHAYQMLIGAFDGNMASVVTFCKEHRIKLNQADSEFGRTSCKKMIGKTF